MAIDYPAGLPKPVQSGYAIQTVSPLTRTTMQSGRARQRRTFTSVPQSVSVSWIMTTQEAQLFENFFQVSLVDGSLWFFADLQTPLGFSPVECRFTDIYNGPSLIAFNKWQFSATLETKDRNTLAGGDWAIIMPSFILMSDIFDIAINKEWPEA
jgi:hypothetical protein